MDKDDTAEYEKRYGVSPAKADHESLVKMIEDAFADGLTTQLDPFPETDREFSTILDELRDMDANQLRAKLDVSGWKLSPHGEDEMRCQE